MRAYGNLHRGNSDTVTSDEGISDYYHWSVTCMLQDITAQGKGDRRKWIPVQARIRDLRSSTEFQRSREPHTEAVTILCLPSQKHTAHDLRCRYICTRFKFHGQTNILSDTPHPLPKVLS